MTRRVRGRSRWSPRGIGERVWLVAVAVAVWEVVTRAVRETYFPPPSTIVGSLHELWFSGPASRLFLSDNAVDDFSTSLAHLFVGWAAASAAGIVTGAAIGRSRILYALLNPVLEFLRAVPPVTLVPFFVAVFRLGATMQVVTIASGVMWPVLLNTCEGVRTVPPLQLDTARVFGIGRFRGLVTIVLPAAAPKIFAGLRVALSFALILMVVSELVGGTAGIGSELIGAQRTFELPRMWAGIVMLGVLGCLFNAVFVLLERRLLAWHTGSQRLAP
ncbi:ABC-type nitrate/sulfonate/bicarbonate transport system permease component [Actinomadura pelletieri DSM 43383]|uniref:ABC-type nitrate/sulfonate/bicarbonate transport system permease component n=1 Tax=Actinomadura pelletieri DSM 43383 TaxID=1120940 RepID=A0A495QB74_9ACTN|nr:ABC transporter permease [Actinomadura pelletieri]RKS68939.1 ABC-type nitrate/sulfonate/bicarbonate transport system permease component [Actinomadura pelletieri DSM 43383]